MAFLISCQEQSEFEREADFNFDWKFQLQADTGLVSQIPLDDSQWRDVRLPHDWSVEMPFDSTLEGCTGYLPGGVGWYQKTFVLSERDEDKLTYVLFDGVYNNAQFWLNGTRLGENPYGYSPVYFDLTPYLKAAPEENVLSVYVDHSRYADSRWYTGSGIYRNVKLVTVDKLHIPIWGTYITTPWINEEKAVARMAIQVHNDYDTPSSFTLSTKIYDAEGQKVAEEENQMDFEAGQMEGIIHELDILNPKLWDCENPNMYKAVTSLIQDGNTVDEYTTPFGIRNIEFKVGEGFFLNGEPTLMKGVCLHHDAGLVGAAVPRGVWKRRLSLLKEGGVNAIRTSHNPYSQVFMDLCDEMGFLVQDEIFDEFDYPKDKRQNYHDRHDDYITRGYTEHFQEWGKSDLARTILRDRNHPSVVQWSIGNEIEWTYLHYRYVTGFWEDPNDPQNSGDYWGSPPIYSPEELKRRYEESEKGEYILTETAERLNGWIKELDTSRPTTTNLVIPHISMVSGYADAVDLVGYSYRNVEIPWAKKHFPNVQTSIHECPGNWDDWKYVLENPGVYSMFMWTGIGYIGERDGRWPDKSGWGDMLDIAGFKNQGWNYFKSIWVDEPHLSIGTKSLKRSGFQWDELSGQLVSRNGRAFGWGNSNMHWNYQKGDTMVVEVCSNHSTVELLINGRSLGYRSMSESPDRLLRWMVPFEEGTLTARTGFDGAELCAELSTASKPATFTLTSDKTTLKADAYDVAHLVVQLTDEHGNPVLTDNAEISFEMEGDARILGVDNGAPDNIQGFQSDHIKTDKGRCLIIVQSGLTSGPLHLTALAEGYGSQKITINIQ